MSAATFGADASDSSTERRPVQTLGAAIRATRKRLGMSVEQLADQSDVSQGLISQLERGRGNPALGTITRLADALGLPMAHLLEPSTAGFSVVRVEGRYLLPLQADIDPSLQATRELLSPRGHTGIQVIKSTLPPGFSNIDRPFRHIGTETVAVMSGKLEVHHGNDHALLDPGDSATYDCSTLHWWANGHDDETVVLGAFTPFER